MEKIKGIQIDKRTVESTPEIDAINDLIDENQKLLKRVNALFDLYAGVETDNQKLEEAILYLAAYAGEKPNNRIIEILE